MNDGLVHIINKEIGKTPLQALEDFRLLHPEIHGTPLTYAGRLDPMASGKMIILAGSECKNKDKYLNLDKVYEVEILFGISTDTYDLLGVPKAGNAGLISTTKIDWNKYVGQFIQPYPPYSSKTVSGTPLHTLARNNELPAVMPAREVSIRKIEVLSDFTITASELLREHASKINLVKGDFRQMEIMNAWQNMLGTSNSVYHVAHIQVECSSGTYMRSLSNQVGIDYGTSAMAISIKRVAFKDSLHMLKS